MILDDLCRNYWIFSFVHLVGVWVNDNKGSALVGDLLCVHRFLADNMLIITQSRPKDRLRGQALPSRGIRVITHITYACLSLVFSRLGFLLDADGRTGQLFPMAPATVFSSISKASHLSRRRNTTRPLLPSYTQFRG